MIFYFDRKVPGGYYLVSEITTIEKLSYSYLSVAAWEASNAHSVQVKDTDIAVVMGYGDHVMIG